MKNLVVCPTRGRSRLFADMYESFKSTAVCSDLVVILDEDDMSNYSKVDAMVLINDGIKTVTELANMAFKAFPGYDFYSLTNDDFVYRTSGWDDLLCRKGRISYGNDLAARAVLPTTSVIDGDIIRALGWLQLPTLKYMCGDLVWRAIGGRLGILRYLGDVIIEHVHWSNLKREPDEVTKIVNSTQIMREDNVAYRDWLHNRMMKDVEKVRAKLGL